MPAPSDKTKRMQSNYEAAFSSDVGRTVLQNLMGEFQFFRTSNAPGDPYQTHFHEGERNVICHILGMMQKAKAGMMSGSQVIDAASSGLRDVDDPTDILERE